MAATKYSYSVSGDFPNQKVNPTSLKNEIEASSIAITFGYVFVKGDVCDLWFDDVLSTEDQLTLDGVVAAHQATPPYIFVFKASSKVVGSDPKSITNPSEWEEAGGAVTNISFFLPDVTKAWGRFSVDVKTNGAGAKLRVIRQSDGAVCTAADIDIPDTGGTWQIVSFWANQNQPPGPDRFVLQGFLNGATDFQVRDCAVSLMACNQ